MNSTDRRLGRHGAFAVLVAMALFGCSAFASGAQSDARPVTVRVGPYREHVPLGIERLTSLGQGGLSDDLMWDGRRAEVRALHPRLIRLFLQQYFDPTPRAGEYHFESLDRAVDLILRTA